MESEGKMTRITLKKFGQMKLNVQIVNKTTPLSDDLGTYTKVERNT